MSSLKNKKSSKVSLQGTTKEIQHYNAVLIEALKSDFRAVTEGMNGMEVRLVRRMDETDQKNEKRFDDIEAILRLHTHKFEENDKRWESNEKRLDRIDGRLTNVEVRLTGVESRLTNVETKLDLVVDKVEKHDQEIEHFKVQGVRH